MTDDMTLGLAGFAFLFLMILLQVPVGVAMALVGVVGTGILIGFEPALALLAIEPSAALASESLAIIAMFLLMGNLAHAGGLSAELYRLADDALGHLKGGLIYATIGACAGFGAISGSSVATTATMTRVALPEMLDRGYARSMAAGAIAAGGTLGMIIPPSLVLILYGVLTENSIIALFLAAIVPGCLAVVFYFLSVGVTVRLVPALAQTGSRKPLATQLTTLKQSWGVLALIVAVTGGIYGGIFTVPEAASVGASLALLLGVVRKKLTRSSFLESLSETASSTGMIFIIIIGASIYSYFATLSGLPNAAVQGIQSLGLPDWALLGALLVFYLALGAIFDTIAAMVLTLPVVYPLIIGMGYDPIWWGVINIVVLELGMITPPFGINVFVLHGMRSDLPLGQIYRGIVPFLIADILRLGLLVSVPALSLWLPRQLGWL